MTEDGLVDDQDRSLVRRRFLQGSIAALITSLSGCTALEQTANDVSNELFPPPSHSETANQPDGIDETPSSSQLPDATALHFHSTRANDGESFTFTYEDLPEFRGPKQINEKNSGHPDTSNIEVVIEDGSVTLTLLNVATLRDVTIQLWGKTRSEWENLGEQDIEANNPDAEDTSNLLYHEETVEFTDTPKIETYLVSAYSLVVIDSPPVPEWDTATPGRILKTVRTFAIPYDSPNGRQIRYFSGPTVNYEAYKGELKPPTVRNNTLVEDHSNGDKTIFVVVNTYGGEYGVATTLSKSVVSNQNYSTKDWARLLMENNDAEDWQHWGTLAEEIQATSEKLGIWDDSLQSKLRTYSQFTSALQYKVQYPMRHPTAALLAQDGKNCTEKTLIFNALLQHAPFNYEGEDASYLYCRYNNTAHLVAGINVTEFDELQSDWETYTYNDAAIEKLDAPNDEEFVPIDVTNGKFGKLGRNSFSNVYVWDNIDGQLVQNSQNN